MVSFSLPLTLALLLAALVYTRGWYRLRSTVPNMIPIWRVAAFGTGLLSVWIALGSPLAHRDHELLSIHMVQHLLLMAIGAPLILLGAPVLLLKYGLPQRLGGRVLELIFRSSRLQTTANALTRPAFCWLAGTVAVIVWHVPAAFELAMQSHSWHDVQRATFFAAGILFWLPVIEPRPRVTHDIRWSVPLYLFLGTLPCDALSAFLTFSDRVVYQSYLSGPQIFSLSALRDQETAGALMWVCVTFIYLIPAVVVVVRILGGPSDRIGGTEP
jgi:cytochrome c oxidase assembly factor CtaG